MGEKFIHAKGVRVNNLKNIEVKIPRDKLVVFTGVSGSGKSSLAFDTLYAEGHRRFVESLSSYARMFLGQMDKPDIDFIEGLSPSISIDQKTTSKNPRSTVGTVTEIYDYLRLIFARIGIPHCPVCGKEIRMQTTDTMISKILQLEPGTRFEVCSPVVRGKKGMHKKVFEDGNKAGYTRVRVDGNMFDINDNIELDKNVKHDIEIVVDRLIMKDGIRPRLSDSVETALKLADGELRIRVIGDEERIMSFSQNYACEEHGVSFGELQPRMFSFNAPYGACEKCSGLGMSLTLSPEKIIPNRKLSLRDGAIAVNGFKSLDDETWSGPLYEAAMKQFGVDLDTPIRDYPKEAYDALMYGTGAKLYTIDRYFDKYAHRQTVPFAGVIPTIESRRNSLPDYYEQFTEEKPCDACHGMRLKPEILSVTVGGKNIHEVCSLSVSDCLDFFNNIELDETEWKIATEIVKEIKARLGFLKSVGLEYLTLSRKAGSLSGGESQRIRLATQIGSSLVGVLYILDEPSIGLHSRDNGKLIDTLKKLRDVGNSLIVVEHDEEMMRESDFIVDVGPGAGVHGGQIVATGTPEEIMANEGSLTGKYLSGKLNIPLPDHRREGNGGILRVKGAREHNLKNIDVDFPLGCFICVTGVSGSGKSSLVNSVLAQALMRELNGAYSIPGAHDEIEGMELLDKVIVIDQSPIGRTPRSNPATYTGLFTEIRNLFAATREAKIRGYSSGRFSFNVKGGRCEACEGDGVKKIEMHFLPDVYVKCDVCRGRRYNADTLEVRYKDKNIYDVLEMTVEEGVEFFSAVPKIASKLKTLYEVGLGYIKIGQSSTTLSGGEAQRVKLATELSRRATGKTVYILDEPTTGLHADDVKKLIVILQRLTDSGNTVIVIEHNLDLIKNADYIIDLGPEGGDGGGRVIATGTPEQIAGSNDSYTGEYLKRVLKNESK
ncbi:MAG: excinuclease ABC subunit UvrA [Clostridia bacterium]|nr:excinuclease ABC subunit UvrA [Clostridia bacterium]